MPSHGQAQDYAFINIRSSAVLTGSYVPATVLNATTPNFPCKVELRNQLLLYVSLTLGNLTDARLKIEFSHDGTTWYQETFSNISSGTETDYLGEHVFTTTGNYRLAIPIKDMNIRVSMKGTGDATNSLAAIGAVLGVI